jgi:prepilin-type N-terminal cleavage/methylation domain-containing protein
MESAMKRRGFTLVELMTVIGLIAMLMIILIPGLVAARRYALRAECTARLRSIGVALNSYSTDDPAKGYPERSNPDCPYDIGTTAQADNGLFDQLLQNYIKEPKLLYCPDSSEASLVAPGSSWDRARDDKRRTGYVFLDGKPDVAALWQIPDAPGGLPGILDGTLQGFRSCRKNYVKNASGYYVLDHLDRDYYRPVWGSGWMNQMQPILGDLVLERPGQAWIVSHGTVDQGNPLGMNMLFADMHVNWVVADVPDPNVATRHAQRVWRRVWTDGTNFIRWIWAIDDNMNLPNQPPDAK